MTENLAPYACDKCRSRKVACSRARSGCQRCKDESIVCTFSRSGVIRRNRKRKHESLDSNQPSPSAFSSTSGPPKVDGSDLQSHLAADIEVTRERLDGLDASQHNSLGALSSLSEACAAVWHDASVFDGASGKFFLFENRTVSWVKVFIDTLNRGRPLFITAPPEVLDHLRGSRPDQVRDRAWLIMYYSIVLSNVSSNNPEDEETKAKLRCNLWIALNDVRLLLEPSEPNIQALVLLACHVEEFTTPSLTWLLATNACRMLQALGVNHRRFDPQTRERRILMFWHLNLLDKGLAIIFGRSPTFHRAMAREIPLPTLDQLLPYQPHLNSTSTHALFGAHYIHQIMLLSLVIADIWSCLYDEPGATDYSIGLVSKDLESWYHQARTILEAAALTEKPFLDAKSGTSIDLGLCTLNFNYEYLRVLLARSSSLMKKQCLESSKRMLSLLENMVSDSEEMYNGIVWQLLCCPFTPFLTLFGEIISNCKGGSDENKVALAAMEQLPVFLGKMSLRNTLAAKLERIAVVFFQHAKCVVYPSGLQASETVPSSTIPSGALPDSWSSIGNTLDWDSLFNYAPPAPSIGLTQVGGHDIQPTDLTSWTNDFFGDAVLDWIGSDIQV